MKIQISVLSSFFSVTFTLSRCFESMPAAQFALTNLMLLGIMLIPSLEAPRYLRDRKGLKMRSRPPSQWDLNLNSFWSFPCFFCRAWKWDIVYEEFKLEYFVVNHMREKESMRDIVIRKEASLMFYFIKKYYKVDIPRCQWFHTKRFIMYINR